METTQKVFRSGLEFIGEIKVNKSNKELMVEKSYHIVQLYKME